MKFYAGIGSRSIPSEECYKLTQIATHLEKLGYTLRSGGAEGADKAFEYGVRLPINKIILRSKHSTKKSEEIASKIHPVWHMCDEYARQLHGRNVQIILGQQLNEPVEFVIAWTSDGTDRGGTRTGLVLAKQYEILCFNLANREQNFSFAAFLQTLEK